MTVGHLPEDVSIDHADVQHPPEDVLPPPPASPAHTVVGPQLVEPVDPSHQAVVPLHARRNGQVNLGVVSSHTPHHIQPSIVSGDHEYVTLVSPFQEHDVVAIGPLEGLTRLQQSRRQCVRILAPIRPGCATHVGARTQQITGEFHGGEIIICIDVALLMQIIPHELHDDAVAEIMGGCHVVDLSSGIDSEGETVTSGCIAEAPQLDPPFDRLLGHILLPSKPAIKLYHRLVNG